jgi:hypothetical protein
MALNGDIMVIWRHSVSFLIILPLVLWVEMHGHYVKRQ